MSEVIDRPKLDQPPVEIHKPEAIKPPQRYVIEAWSPGRFCGGKLMVVITEEFSIPESVAATLITAMQSSRKIPVALGLSKEVAEAKADSATRRMDEMVNGCPCGSRLKFVPVPME